MELDTEEGFFPECFFDDSQQASQATYMCYDSYSINTHENLVSFHYSLRDSFSSAKLGSFVSRLQLKIQNCIHVQEIGVFNVGMVLMHWYWMGFATERLVVHCGTLDFDQLQFWRDFYKGVSSEFCMVNNINLFDSIQVEHAIQNGNKENVVMPPNEHAGNCNKPNITPKQNAVLVPMGAGKDSLTVFELLKAQGVNGEWFFLGDHIGEYEEVWRYKAIANASGAPNVIIAGHDFDVTGEWNASRITKLVPCGHAWAGLVAFVSVLVASMDGFDCIAVGNERSASNGNCTWRGHSVNHQFDKSLEFEKAVTAYVKSHIDPNIHYFSLLSPLWELQIARLFSELCVPKYLNLFLSCNEPIGSRWCAKCPKCLFVFVVLSAFLSPSCVMSIFGDNLLEQEALGDRLMELVGWKGAKPFECVGTEKETRLAISMCREKYAEWMPGYLPVLLRSWQDDEAGSFKGLLTDCGDATNFPGWLPEKRTFCNDHGVSNLK